MKTKPTKQQLVQVVLDVAVSDYLNTASKALALCQAALRSAYNVPHLPSKQSGAIHTALDMAKSLERGIGAAIAPVAAVKPD